MELKTVDEPKTIDPDFIKTEYIELSRLFAEISKFRFTVPAFYLAAVAFLMKEGSPRTLFALLVITLFIWLMELRTRELLNVLRRGGQYIEEYYWKHNIKQADPLKGELPFFNLFMQPTTKTPIQIFGENTVVDATIRRYITHGSTLDFLFLTIIIITITLLIFSWIGVLPPSPTGGGK